MSGREDHEYKCVNREIEEKIIVDEIQKADRQPDIGRPILKCASV